jgi:hypothetical protein
VGRRPDIRIAGGPIGPSGCYNVACNVKAETVLTRLDHSHF